MIIIRLFIMIRIKEKKESKNKNGFCWNGI